MHATTKTKHQHSQIFLKREGEQNQHAVHEKIQWGTTMAKKPDALLEGLEEEQATDNQPLLHQ